MTSATTIVLSTYGRPSTLVCAVQSVLHQTFPDWRLVVIGDGCGEETSAAMAPFLADPRIRYVNLPWRCGEQALPNSAGMACATTDRIAFLNHDDLWLPSHLATANQQLDKANADFFFGRSAWIWGAPASAQAPLIIDTVSPVAQDFSQVFTSSFQCVEPVSAWVVARDLAHKVGPWRSSSELFRPSIQDWVLRAYRAGARVTPGVDVTCLKFENQWSAEAPARRYDTPATSQEAGLAMMQSSSGLAELTLKLRQLVSGPQTVDHRMNLNVAPVEHPDVDRLAKQLITSHAANYFLHTNLDAYTWLCAEVGLARGWRWRWALELRTGEAGLTPPALKEVLEYVADAVGRHDA